MKRNLSVFTKLLGSFLLFSGVVSVVLVNSIWYIDARMEREHVAEDLDEAYGLIVRMKEQEKLFLSNELLNSAFYESQSSPYLQLHQQYRQKISVHFQHIEKQGDLDLLNIPTATAQQLMTAIKQSINGYAEQFDLLAQKVLERGYQSHGLVGKMRQEAHQLEDVALNQQELVKVLSLRRHEKDFIIRKELKYQNQFNQVASTWLRELTTAPVAESSKIKYLSNYQTRFNEFAAVELEIGLGQNNGIHERLDQRASEIYVSMGELETIIKSHMEENDASIRRTFWVVGFCLITLSICLALWLAKTITRPVLLLNRKMADFVEQGFKKRIVKIDTDSTDEIGTLTRNFNTMADRLNETLVELNQKNEELLESNDQLNSFASIVSHDLKSPLRTMSSFVSLLKRRTKGKLGESEQEYMDFIESGSKKMTELVNDLHEFSTVNSKGITIEQVAFEPFLKEVLQLVDFQVKESNAVIRVKSDLGVINCDVVKIRQVLQNLISNAMKYVAKGVQPDIRITCGELAKYWQFSIRDNGIGIPEEYAKEVFQPFNRAGVGQEFEGTGLGLSICKKIVKHHGGDIWIESLPAGGTTFHFTIAKQLRASLTATSNSNTASA